MTQDNVSSRIFRLQRAVAYAITFGGFLAAALSFLRLMYIDNKSVSEALLELNVALVVVYLSTGILSALWRGLGGQGLQLFALAVVSLASAFTGTRADLSPLLFLGVFLALSTVYPLPKTLRRWIILVLTGLFLPIWAIGILSHSEETVLSVLISMVGAATMTAIVFSLFSYVRAVQTHHEQILTDQVNARTIELQSALTRSEELRHRNGALLREVHHRTKNNLQVVASLLSLRQTHHMNSAEEARRAISTAQMQVYAMAMAHDLFHQSRTRSTVNLETLVTRTLDICLKQQVLTNVDVDMGDLKADQIDMDTAISLGLILNELATNAGVHAYPGQRVRKIWIRGRRDGEMRVIDVIDDGIGFRTVTDSFRPTTTGLRIVWTLASQLGGSVTAHVHDGTTFSVRIPPASQEETAVSSVPYVP